MDAAELAAAVDATLADPRGWTAPGDLSLQRVGAGEAPSFRVRLATPATVDAHCAPLADERDLLVPPGRGRDDQRGAVAGGSDGEPARARRLQATT